MSDSTELLDGQKLCKGCEYPFWPARPTRKFCGYKCYHDWLRRNPPTEVREQVCKYCGMPYRGKNVPPKGAYRFSSTRQLEEWATVCSARCYHKLQLDKANPERNPT